MPRRPATHRPPSPPKPQPSGPAQGILRANYRRWRGLRLSHLRTHPLCVECEKVGRLESATDVDHVTPHKGDPALFWDADNLQSLCHACHSRKTVADDGGFGRPTRAPSDTP